MLYLKPLSSWIVNELNKREDMPEMSMFKMPFAILTSAAVAAQNLEIDTANQRYTSGNQPFYRGCIIGNMIDTELNYGKDVVGTSDGDTNRTVVGVDFDGKIIYTVNETMNMRRPAPIIESIDINTDGQNNASKTAQISIRVFTLKQLEMFELFFLRPGLNLLLEFGTNFQLAEPAIQKYKEAVKMKPGNITTNSNDTMDKAGNTLAEMKLSDIIIDKSDFDKYITVTFDEYFCTKRESIEYLKRIMHSRGQYEVFAGKLIDFSYSFNEDGTYDVQIELAASNTVSLAIPTTPSTTTTNNKVHTKDDDTIRSMLISDFNLDKLVIDKQDISTHTFNFKMPPDSNKANLVSETKYLSLHFIVKYLVNYIVNTGIVDRKSYEITYTKVLHDGKETDSILCTSNANIMSSSESVIFPGRLPTVVVTNNSVTLNTNKGTNAPINGLSFNYSPKNLPQLIEKSVNGDSIKEEYIQLKSDDTSGHTLANAMNIFVRYDDVLESWRKSVTRTDFLASILGIINENSYNLFHLIVSPMESNPSQMVISDSTFRTLGDNISNLSDDKYYRFKVGTVNSIVKSFTFQMQMGEAVAAQTIYQRADTIGAILDPNSGVKKPDDAGINANYTNIVQTSFYSNYPTADGFISGDAIELEFIKKSRNSPQVQKIVEYPKTTTRKSDTTDLSKLITVSLGSDVYTDTGYMGWDPNKPIDLPDALKDFNKNFNNEEQNKKVQTQLSNTNNPTDASGTQTSSQRPVGFQGNKNNPNAAGTDTDSSTIHDGKFIRFNVNNQAIPLILLDSNVVLNAMGIKLRSRNEGTLTPISVTLVIDGMSGLASGEMFKISGIPEIYNKNGAFQITNIKHTVDDSRWDTTIEADWRILNDS